MGIVGLAFCKESLFASPEDKKVEIDGFYKKDRSLWIHRGDKDYRVEYFKDGLYTLAGYNELCEVFRDTHENSVVQIDYRLFDVLAYTQAWLSIVGISKPITLHSGYRTVTTNAKLENAARNSMHLHGMACDFKVEGIGVDYLAKVGRYFGGLGIGIYSTHLHVDTWKLRSWRGASS